MHRSSRRSDLFEQFFAGLELQLLHELERHDLVVSINKWIDVEFQRQMCRRYRCTIFVTKCASHFWSVSDKFNFRDEVVCYLYRGWGAQKLGCPEKVNIYY